jgi:hypothetical protein
MNHDDPRWREHLGIIATWGETSTANGTPPPNDEQLWTISRVRHDLNLPEQIDPALLGQLREAFHTGRQRRRDITPAIEAGMAWPPTPGAELIPLLLAAEDLRAVAQALHTTADRWAQVAAEAAAGAKRPPSAPSSEPGWMNIEPTPAGYTGIAGLAAQEQARYLRLLQRLQPIVETADTLDTAAHTPTQPPAASWVALVGISAAFTPDELEALVNTAAEAVCGDLDELSSRQRELAARAYALLQDVIDG